MYRDGEPAWNNYISFALSVNAKWTSLRPNFAPSAFFNLLIFYMCFPIAFIPFPPLFVPFVCVLVFLYVVCFPPTIFLFSFLRSPTTAGWSVGKVDCAKTKRCTVEWYSLSLNWDVAWMANFICTFQTNLGILNNYCWPRSGMFLLLFTSRQTTPTLCVQIFF